MFLPFFMGPSIVILLPALVLAVYAQYRVRSTYAKYSRLTTTNKMTAQQAATRILEHAGIQDVTFGSAKGPLTDQYDPRKKLLRLSVPDSTSVAAIGVAAHEAGHAIQDSEGYTPLVLRTSIVPVANVGSQLAFPLFFIGFIFQYPALVTLGILAFSLAVLITLVTLPVELDASRRAVKALRSTYIVNTEELSGVKEVLFAAALTYIAAAAMAALRLVTLLFASRRR